MYTEVCPSAHLARLCDLAVVGHGLLEDGLQIVGGLVHVNITISRYRYRYNDI